MDLIDIFNALDDGSEKVRESYERCPFSFPGSKSDSLKHILPLLPYTNTFIDVFGGSGVVILNRQKSNLDVFNDRHSGVTCFFRTVRHEDSRLKLIERICLTPHSREEFMWCKEHWKDNHIDDIERAARWYTMVQASFAGRGRYFGRVLKGKGMMWTKIQENLDLFEMLAQRFLTIQIENLDWRHCLKDFDSHQTVFYIDPPYWGHNIYDDKMSKEDHIEMCNRIFECKGFVALSGYNNNNVYDSFPWDSKHEWEIKDKMLTQALSTETSNVRNMDHIERKISIEHLWIKEFE